MFGDSIVVQNMACCPHLCEVFQQNLNTSKQMFQKKWLFWNAICTGLTIFLLQK